MTSSIIPEYASLVWVSAQQIHIAVPTSTGEPYIISTPRTTVGLAEALGIMCKAFEAKAHLPPDGEKPKSIRPQAHAVVRRPPVMYTEEQRSIVRGLLKKQGLI